VHKEVVKEQHIEQPDLQRALEEELYGDYLYQKVAKQPAVVPNEGEDDCNGRQQVKVQQKNH
jgi:hypothetical protein